MLSYQPPPFTTLLIRFKLFSGVRLLMYSVKIALFTDTRILIIHLKYHSDNRTEEEEEERQAGLPSANQT